MEKAATIFDIGGFRDEDGPGIRTILFFKGCPLRCLWCSNPFGLSPKPQMVLKREHCTGCGHCVPVCPQGANRVVDDKVETDFSKCKACGACVLVCPVGTRVISGKEYTARAMFQEACKDVAFYRMNSGGVTLSGGEVLMQHEVASEMLHLCKRSYITTCIETSAYAPWEHLREVAQYCNDIFVDLKHMDSEKHKKLTGVPNELILKNIIKLCEFAVTRAIRVIVRKPIVAGYTDEEMDLIATAKFISKLAGTPELNLLPYHNMGVGKYDMIGEVYRLEESSILGHSHPRILHAQQLCQEYCPQNRVSIGGWDIKATK